MTLAIAIILIIICVALAFFVLIQNPKGGGLSGSFGGVGTQMMGVQQSTDTVEKGTWILASIMALLCILSVAFGDRSTSGRGVEKSRSEKAVKNAPINAPAPATAPALPSSTSPSAPTSATGQTAPASNQAPPAPTPTPASNNAATTTK